MAFHGPQPADKVVARDDDNKLNNTPGNLKYNSNTQNVRDAYKSGLMKVRGEDSGRAILNADLVRFIRSQPDTAKSADIARAIGLADKPHIVCRVRSGMTWKHITA
jgi:hypothetical protein